MSLSLTPEAAAALSLAADSSSSPTLVSDFSRLFFEDFESGVASWHADNSTITQDTTHVYGGSYALKCVTNTSAADQGFSKSVVPPVDSSILIAVSPGYVYKAAALFYGDPASTLRLLIDEYDSGLTYKGSSTTFFSPTGGAWDAISVTRTIGVSGAYVNLRVLTATNPSPSTFWVDSLTFDAVTPTPPLLTLTGISGGDLVPPFVPGSSAVPGPPPLALSGESASSLTLTPEP